MLNTSTFLPSTQATCSATFMAKEVKGIAEVIIGKQRNGPIGTVRMSFFGEYTRFENYAPTGGEYGH